jgi:hypothetical protein
MYRNEAAKLVAVSLVVGGVVGYLLKMWLG